MKRSATIIVPSTDCEETLRGSSTSSLLSFERDTTRDDGMK